MRDDRVPVLVGVGQVRGNRGRTVQDAREPASLVLDAVAAAARDAAAPGLLADLDAIDTVHVTSWAYADLAGRIAAAVGARPAHTAGTRIGGGTGPRCCWSGPRRGSRRGSRGWR